MFLTWQITKSQVDRFVPGGRVPSCQLYVKWTGQQGQPVELVHRVKLLGAKEPNNFFLMRPPALQRSQGYHFSDLLVRMLNLIEMVATGFTAVVHWYQFNSFLLLLSSHWSCTADVQIHRKWFCSRKYVVLHVNKYSLLSASKYLLFTGFLQTLLLLSMGVLLILFE